MIWLFTALLIGGGLWLLAKYVANGDPKAMSRTIRWGTVGMLGVLALASFGLGRFPFAFILGGLAILAAVMPMTQIGHAAKDGKSSSSGSARQPRAHMTRAEAIEILGLSSRPSAEEIREAYKRLIVKYHPDQGGSDYLAAKINQAKDVLLGQS